MQEHIEKVAEYGVELMQEFGDQTIFMIEGDDSSYIEIRVSIIPYERLHS
jgi:hypothetical protein